MEAFHPCCLNQQKKRKGGEKRGKGEKEKREDGTADTAAPNADFGVGVLGAANPGERARCLCARQTFG